MASSTWLGCPHERAAALIQLVENARGGDPALDNLAEKIDASLHHDARLFVDAVPTKALRRDARV